MPETDPWPARILAFMLGTVLGCLGGVYAALAWWWG
jgi:hypothetical protein